MKYRLDLARGANVTQNSTRQQRLSPIIYTSRLDSCRRVLETYQEVSFIQRYLLEARSFEGNLKPAKAKQTTKQGQIE